MKILISGRSGFVGRHLANRLVAGGHDVSGFALDGEGGGVERGDVQDRGFLREILDRRHPDAIVHLAAATFVPGSYRDPRKVYEVNLLGTIELLEAAREVTPSARFLLVSSGEVYGMPAPESLPLREEHPLSPVSPYAASKAAAEVAALQVHRAHGLAVVVVRPFQHTGPGQAPVFVCPEFARSIAAAEAGRGPARLRVGNLDVERPFLDVRDVAHAYGLLLERGRVGEVYNVAGSSARSVRSVLDRLRSLARVPIEVDVDPAKVRRSDPSRIEASTEKLSRETGWRPEIPLDDTLGELLEEWRQAFRPS